jgi:hypothetical protein
MSLLTGNCTTQDLPTWEDWVDPTDPSKEKRGIRQRHHRSW